MDEEECIYPTYYLLRICHVQKAVPVLGTHLLQSFSSAQGARFSEVMSISLTIRNLGFKAAHCGVIKTYYLFLESDNESLHAFSLKLASKKLVSWGCSEGVFV